MQPMAATVRALPNYRLAVTFKDGASGEVDLSPLVHKREAGVFAELRDPRRFAEVFINAEWGHVEWPNGADIDPYVLYAQATGTPLR